MRRFLPAILCLALLGCTSICMVGTPGDHPDLKASQVLDTLAANDLLRFRSVRVMMTDGRHFTSALVALEADSLVWRPRDGIPFYLAPQMRVALREVSCLEFSRRFWPAMAGLATGALAGRLAPIRDEEPQHDGIYFDEDAASRSGSVIAGACFGAVIGGVVGHNERLLLTPTMKDLERLHRQSGTRKAGVAPSARR